MGEEVTGGLVTAGLVMGVVVDGATGRVDPEEAEDPPHYVSTLNIAVAPCIECYCFNSEFYKYARGMSI